MTVKNIPEVVSISSHSYKAYIAYLVKLSVTCQNYSSTPYVLALRRTFKGIAVIFATIYPKLRFKVVIDTIRSEKDTEMISTRI